MRIKVLGCSGGVGPGLRTTTLLVNDEILIDAGTGVGDLSLEEMSRISHVFLTHSHLDHVAGLAFLADNLFDLVERPVQVLASAATLDALKTHIFNWKIWPDFSKLPDEDHPLLQFRELAVHAPVSMHDFKVTAFPVLHTVPAVGFALEEAHATFAFSGDTYASDELWEALNGLQRLDRLMIELAFADHEAELGRVSRHFTPSLLGQELGKLRHRPELYLTHHKPGWEEVIERESREVFSGRPYRHVRRGDIITT